MKFLLSIIVRPIRRLMGSRLVRAGVAVCLLGGVWGCASDDDMPAPVQESGWILEQPDHFPAASVPADNPMTEEKIELGRHLFHDKRLSGNETQSCADCHAQERAFSDGKTQAVGSTGETHPRNAMAIVNVAYNSVQTWANPGIDTLEKQHAIPMFGEFPVELGITNREQEVLDRFRQSIAYQDLFAEAFPEEEDPITFANIIKALATFSRSLVSWNSPYDQFVAGDTSALTAEEIQGMELFFSERLECHHCHGGFNFQQSTTHENSTIREVGFHNTGLYNIGGTGDYPINNTGLFEVTGDPEDMGKFRAPTLRNIALTAPYMHDGSVATLEEVVRIYEAGGRNIESGPYAGDGRQNPHKSGFIHGFFLTTDERQALIAFLHALTDEDFVTNPKHANPFPE